MSICGKCIHYEICDEYVSPCETFPEIENGCPCYKSKDDFSEVKHGEWIEKDDGWGGVLYDTVLNAAQKWMEKGKNNEPLYRCGIVKKQNT